MVSKLVRHNTMLSRRRRAGSKPRSGIVRRKPTRWRGWACSESRDYFTLRRVLQDAQREEVSFVSLARSAGVSVGQSGSQSSSSPLPVGLSVGRWVDRPARGPSIRSDVRSPVPSAYIRRNVEAGPALKKPKRNPLVPLNVNADLCTEAGRVTTRSAMMGGSTSTARAMFASP